MGEANMRIILGLDNNGEGDKLDGVYGDEVTLLNNGTWKCTRDSYVSYID